MRKTLKYFVIALLAFTFVFGGNYSAKADEGMWLPLFLKKYNIEDMKKRALNLLLKIFIVLTKQA